MAKTKTVLEAELRKKYLDLISDFLKGLDEDILLVKSNEIAFPTVDEEHNDKFLTVTISVKQGSRDDNEGYDGYAIAEQYAEKVKANEEKAKTEAEKKAKKIAKDKAQREAMAKAKAEHLAKKGEG